MTPDRPTEVQQCTEPAPAENRRAGAHMSTPTAVIKGGKSLYKCNSAPTLRTQKCSHQRRAECDQGSKFAQIARAQRVSSEKGTPSPLRIHRSRAT